MTMLVLLLLLLLWPVLRSGKEEVLMSGPNRNRLGILQRNSQTVRHCSKLGLFPT